MSSIPRLSKPGLSRASKKLKAIAADCMIHQLAFDNSLQPNILTTASTGKIIIANIAACQLLGYSKKELLTKTRTTIFDTNERNFIKMLKQRTVEGRSTALVTAIKKNGHQFPCEITSAVFMGQDGIEKAITTIADMSQHILEQKKIDVKKEKIVAHNIVLAELKQKEIDVKNDKIVAHNIVLAKSKQKKIDTQNEEIVADNIVLAKSKQKEIDIKKEKIVADNIVIAKSKQKEIDTEKEKIVADNIVIAKSKQKEVDIKNEKVVAQNIVLEERLEHEIRLKEKQIADAVEDAKDTERSDIGKELHDNINQLLGVSKMYLEMAKQGGAGTEMYLSRSSLYTITAIDEIRKLTKKLTTDIIKNLGLCEAIDNISRDTMEVNPVKISRHLETFKESSVNDKFKLNIYRIVQEQLNNILKHARASDIRISLSQHKDSISLSISDNGVGFDTTKKRTGIGIDNIKSRAEAYNGTADFVSQPGQGCVLTATFPVTDELLNKD